MNRASFFALVVTLAVAALACTARTDGRDLSEQRIGSTAARLDVAPGSLPFPVWRDDQQELDPATGNPRPSWSGTLIDLMAADAWAQCGAHVTSPAEYPLDQYQLYLEMHMTQAECPDAFLGSPPSDFAINNCGANLSLCPAPMKRWARQRQVPSCNVNTSTGSEALVRFHRDVEDGWQVLNPNSFSALTSGGNNVGVAIADAQKQVDIAEVNLCMAQRLREHMASSDSLFLSAEDMRQLLEVIRERAQIAMVQYALLARTFTNPHDPPTNDVGHYGRQTFVALMHWSKQPEAVAILEKMGTDLGAAVQLHIDATRESAQLLMRTASARTRRGDRVMNNGQEDFGAGSWRQRLLALLYGGNPLSGIFGAEVDLSRAGPDAAKIFETAGGTNPVPWETAWLDDAWIATGWPNQEGPITSWQKYATTATTDPHVQQLLALARDADAFYLRELNADVVLPSSTNTFRRIDINRSAPSVWSLVEASLQTQECKKTNPTCSVAVNDPRMPTPATYASSLLWKKYGIQPEHATALVSMIDDVVPLQSQSSQVHLFDNNEPSLLHEVVGARHVTGLHRTLTPAEVASRLPGEDGTWYRLDPKFDALPFGLAERAPLYTSVAPTFLPRSFDKIVPPSRQGFDQGSKVARLGAVSALTVTRDLLGDSLGGATPTIQQSYLARAPQALAAIGAAIGERSLSIRPATSTRGVVRDPPDNCVEYGPMVTFNLCATIVQAASANGATVGWDIGVRSEVSDPFFAPDPVSVVIVPFKGGVESTAALAPTYTSFKGDTRATLLDSAVGRVEVALSAPTAIGTTAQYRVARVDLPREGVFSSQVGFAPAFTVFLKRVHNGETQYQLLAQRLVIAPRDCATRTVDGLVDTAFVCMPSDGQFIAYGGVFGETAERAWSTQAHDWSKPAFDGFDLPVAWIPPFDPTLFGGSRGDDAVNLYLNRARAAADEATNAVKNAIDELLKEQFDDATLVTAQRRAAEITHLEQRALCGDAKPDCDTSTVDLAIFSSGYIPTVSCANASPENALLCLAEIELFKVIPQNVTLAKVVFDHRSDTSAPAFTDYAGGTLQKLLIAQWAALRKMSQLAAEIEKGLNVHQAQIHAAEGENAALDFECKESTLLQAWRAGFNYPVDQRELHRARDGYPGSPSDTFGWSAGPWLAQHQACERAKVAMGSASRRLVAITQQAFAWMASETTRFIEASAALEIAGADISKALQDANLAKAKAGLEASLANKTLFTKFGTHRRYHSYDMWRARALLESTRRYAVAARRAIEARYVVDLSTLRSDEPFVAAPATWADEIYEYDLAAPTSVGLTAIAQNGGGIYPNRLIDYVGNLERFVNGYSVARPTAVAQNDDEVFHVSGPDARVDVVINGSPQHLLSGEVALWEFLCPNATKWVQHPGLNATTPSAPIATLCGGVSPTRARTTFSLDPWGRLYGNVGDEPYAKRHNSRWLELAVNLVGTGVRNCNQSPDPNSCYANAFLRYNLTHVGPAWVTNFDEHWRSMNVPLGSIESAKALVAEQWLDPTGNGFSKPFVASVSRTEFAGRPVGGSYSLELEVTPDVRLDRIDRVQVLTRNTYWVKQGQGAGIPTTPEPSSGIPEWAGLTPLVDWNPINAVTVGSSPVKVSSVTDASGNNNTLTGAPAHEPEYNASNASFNNQPTLSFPVGNQPRATFGDLGIPSAGPVSIIIVGKTPRTGTNSYVFSLPNQNAAFYKSIGTDLMIEWLSSDYNSIASSVSGANPSVMLATLGSGAQRFYVSSLTEVTSTSSVGVNFSGGGMIGDYAALQSGSNNSYTWGGDVARILIFGTVLSSEQRAACMTALGAKYGITIN